MSSYAIITTPHRKVGIELEWGGERGIVEAFLAYCQGRLAEPPGDDGERLAALAAVVDGYFGHSRYVRLLPYTTDREMSQGFNGVYVLSPAAWEIQEHLIPGRTWFEELTYGFDETLAALEETGPGLPSPSSSEVAGELSVGGLTLRLSRGASEDELRAYAAYLALAWTYRDGLGAPASAAQAARVIGNFVGLDAVSVVRGGAGRELPSAGTERDERLTELLLAIDHAQPQGCRLGENYLKGLAPEEGDLAVGEVVYLIDPHNVPMPHVIQAIDEDGRAVVAYNEYFGLTDTRPGMEALWEHGASHVSASELRLAHDPEAAMAEAGLDLRSERCKWELSTAMRLERAVSGWAAHLGWQASQQGGTILLCKDGDPSLSFRVPLESDGDLELRDVLDRMDPDRLAAARYLELADAGEHPSLKGLMRYYKDARTDLEIIAGETELALHDVPAHERSMQKVGRSPLEELTAEALAPIDLDRSADEPEL